MKVSTLSSFWPKRGLSELFFTLVAILPAFAITFAVETWLFERFSSAFNLSMNDSDLVEPALQSFSTLQQSTHLLLGTVGFDPYRDVFLWKLLLNSLVSFCGICGFCAFLDYGLPRRVTMRWKVQQQGEELEGPFYFSGREYLVCMLQAMLNLLVCGPISFLLLWAFLSNPDSRLHNPLLQENNVHQQWNSFSLATEAAKILGCALMCDVWFYTTHWILHQPPFYNRFHKVHHRFTAPTAISGLYVHPVEFVFESQLSVILGPILLKAHPWTACFWVSNAFLNTCASHSGYTFLGAEGHDAHHQYYNYNYGVGGMMDALLGTSFKESELGNRVGKKHK